MIAYECKQDMEAAPPGIFVGTMAEAKKWLKSTKENISSDFARQFIRIYEVDVQNDKAGVIAALNWHPIYTRKREWKVTPRWGMKEVTEQEAE